MFDQRQLNSRCEETKIFENIDKRNWQEFVQFFVPNFPRLASRVEWSLILLKNVSMFLVLRIAFQLNFEQSRRLLIVKKNIAEFRILLAIEFLERFRFKASARSPGACSTEQTIRQALKLKRIYSKRFSGDFRLIHSISRYSNRVRTLQT